MSRRDNILVEIEANISTSRRDEILVEKIQKIKCPEGTTYWYNKSKIVMSRRDIVSVEIEKNLINQIFIKLWIQYS